MIPSPLLLTTGPLAFALITSFLRRWPLVRSTAGVIIAWSIAVSLCMTNNSIEASATLKVENSQHIWDFLGRTMVLTEQIRLTLIFVYLLLGIVFFLTILFRQNRSFVSMSILLMSPLSAALMVRPLVFGTIILLAAVGTMTILIQANRVGSVLVPLRLLMLALIAMVLVLIGDWMVESDQIEYLPAATNFFLLAILIFLGGFPFHIWIPSVFSLSKPLVPIVVLGLANVVIVVFCLNLLNANAVIRINAQFLNLMRISGLVTIVLASLSILVSRTPGRILGYLLMYNIGTTVLAITFSSQSGLDTVLALIIIRVISLVVAGVGLCVIRNQSSSKDGKISDLASLQGLAKRNLLGIALFAYGSLSLIGIPFTPGFTPHWSVIKLVSDREFWQGVVIASSALVAIIGVIRGLLPMLKEPEDIEFLRQREKGAIQTAAILVLSAGIFLGLFPQSILRFAQQMASLF